MALSSTLGLEDTMALLCGPSCLTVDPLGALLDKDGEEAQAWGLTSPFSSSCYADTSLASSFPVASPPSPTHHSLSGKVGADLLSLPWLSDELLDATISVDRSKEDAFAGMDWMTEKIDLSEFDLDSLMGSCNSEEPPSSPEDFIASLEPHMDLDPMPFSDPLFTPFATQEINDHLSALPSPNEIDTEVKSEPPSPVPPCSLSPPPSPSFTLDLGSEVDISENEKPAPVENTPVSEVVVSLSPSLVLVLSPKEELTGASSTAAVVSSDDQSDSDSGIGSVSGSPPHNPYTSPLHPPTSSSRTKPYSISSKSKQTTEAAALTVKVKSVSSGAPRVVEKKLKKMEQNKTAATRYRQKKRAEQDALKTECAELERKNLELAEKADSISKEIQYLKDLMEEVQKAKCRRSKGCSSVAS